MAPICNKERKTSEKRLIFKLWTLFLNGLKKQFSFSKSFLLSVIFSSFVASSMLLSFLQRQIPLDVLSFSIFQHRLTALDVLFLITTDEGLRPIRLVHLNPSILVQPMRKVIFYLLQLLLYVILNILLHMIN